MFDDDQLVFASYGLPWASVHPGGTLRVADIRDADPTAWPPEVRTTAGETLFLERTRADDLAAFCARTGVPVVQRRPIWSDLCEEFLDTDTGDGAATYARLAASGLHRAEVDEIRERLRPLMHAYNFDSGLWEWVDLGHSDVLRAASGVLVPEHLPATLGDLRAFYWWTMAVADRAAVPG